MSACNFEQLLHFVNKQLDLDKQLEVYDHLERCDICRDAVYQLSHDLFRAMLVNCAHGVKPYPVRRFTEAEQSPRAHVNPG
jgi:hypothetical protein